MENDLKCTDEQRAFLNALRADGCMNMLGAGVVLEDAFDLTKHEARKVLADWMMTYKSGD